MTDGLPSLPVKAAERERWTGTIFTFLSTFLYAVSNIVVRYLTEHDVDHSWILFYKEAIGLSILLPWLFLRWGQGRFRFTSRQLVCYVALAAILCQLIGAQLHVLGFAVIGLIITVPLVQSATLLGVAFLGHFMLGNSLSRGRKIAITILIVAMTILSIGKALAAEPQEGSNVSAGIFLLVAAGTIVAGLSYAVYITMLRQVLRRYWKDENSTWLSFKFHHWIGHDQVEKPGERLYSPFPVTLMMAIVLGVGIVIFGSFLGYKHGIPGFFSVPLTTGNADAGWNSSIAWYCMLLSGVSNMAGFFFQIQGLRMTSAVQASLIAVSQMLLLSLVGYWFFAEAINAVVMVGLGLAVYGVIMSAKPER